MNRNIELLTPNGVKTINDDKLFIIAEVGNQFGGSLDKALKLCDVAKEAGADCIKFIFWFPDEIFADKKVMYTYETATGKVSVPMFDMLEKLTMPLTDWFRVADHCSDTDILMMSTLISPSGLDYGLESLDLPLLKISSWDYYFKDLWEQMAISQKPTFIDLGPVHENELVEHLDIFRQVKSRDVVLMHCFHTEDVNQYNMTTIPYLRDKYDVLVGFAAVDFNDDPDIMAVSMGACALEKRLTLDRKGGILHDAISKEPGEFTEYVKRMRAVKQMVGRRTLLQSTGDLEQRAKWFRRIVYDRSMDKGTVVARTDLEAKRGEWGVRPNRVWEFVNKTLNKDVKRNDDLKETDFTD